MKTYIGDGVYVANGNWDGQVIVTAEDGISAQNTIYMEAEQIDGLLAFAVKEGIINYKNLEKAPPIQTGTITGRLDSTKPNMSSLPRRDKFEQGDTVRIKEYLDWGCAEITGLYDGDGVNPVTYRLYQPDGKLNGLWFEAKDLILESDYKAL